MSTDMLFPLPREFQQSLCLFFPLNFKISELERSLNTYLDQCVIPIFFFQNKAKGNQELERQSKFSKVTQLTVKSELVPRTHGFQLRHFSSALSIYSLLPLPSPPNTHTLVTFCENIDYTVLKLITTLQTLRKAKGSAILS